MGDSTGGLREYEVDDSGTKLYIAMDTSFSGFSLLKRSGKVLSVPENLKYHKPYDLKERIRNVILKEGDIVFFEPETKSLCEQQGYKPTETNRYMPRGYTMTTKDFKTIYVVSYNLLICAIDKDTHQVKMLNGKLLVKRFLEEKFGNSNLIKTEKYDHYKSNWCEIVSVNDDEEYEGVFLASDIFADMTYFKQPLKSGMQVLIKKMSSFDIQSCLKDNKYISELQETFAVSRHNIMAYRESENSESIAYGLYAKVREEIS